MVSDVNGAGAVYASALSAQHCIWACVKGQELFAVPDK